MNLRKRYEKAFPRGGADRSHVELIDVMKDSTRIPGDFIAVERYVGGEVWIAAAEAGRDVTVMLTKKKAKRLARAIRAAARA